MRTIQNQEAAGMAYRSIFKLNLKIINVSKKVIKILSSLWTKTIPIETLRLVVRRIRVELAVKF